ncbi:MAG: outer membrane lipoprotein-sorting protein [Gammaproteobacteria bacterium]|nr:outer membrane lipoprotein-sorting protein [Gammaproteobacteria bacterium]
MRLAIYVILVLFSSQSLARDAKEIIKSAIDKYRGETSYSEIEMTIHRPDWERTMSLKAWTQGLDKSLVRITLPKKDAGSGNLLIGDNMWSFTPKINRVIKIPSSMSNQSWMGSDFSNNDIARADDLIDQYNHRLVKEEKIDNRVVYEIESIPHDDAPVVWGKEVLKVRDDDVLLEHAFYDQDGKLIKKLVTLEIKVFSGRTIPAVQRMQKVETKGEWTEVRVSKAEYGIDIPGRTFTLTRLRNPR